MPLAAMEPHGPARPSNRRHAPSRNVSRFRQRSGRSLPSGISAGLRSDPRRQDRAAHRALRINHRRKRCIMKIASYKAGAVASYGIVTDAGIVDAGRRLKNFPTLKSLLAHGSLDELKKLQDERPDHALSAVELLPTVPDPDKILSICLHHATHLAQSGHPTPPHPMIFPPVANIHVGSHQPLTRHH